MASKLPRSLMPIRRMSSASSRLMKALRDSSKTLAFAFAGFAEGARRTLISSSEAMKGRALSWVKPAACPSSCQRALSRSMRP